MPDREFPKTYCVFEGKKIINGQLRHFWIQDVPEEMFPEIIKHLTESFVGDEPTTKYLGCKDDPMAMEDFKVIWMKMLNEKYSIVCMTKDAENNAKIAAFNILTQSKVDGDEHYNLTGTTIMKLFKILDYIENQRDFYKEFNLKTCMKAMGLYVMPEYRGDGLGAKLLEARELLCRSVGIFATVTLFSAIASQICAEKAGFQDFYVESYKHLGEVDPEMKINGIEEHSKLIKYMYKLYK